jgi:hypothetical protein
MDPLLLVVLLPVAGLLLWGLSGASSRAALEHVEAQIRQPGQLAMELGRTFGKAQGKAWNMWFVDAEVRYLAADKAWWAHYKRLIGNKRKRFAENRLALQKDIGEFIDPTDCLKRLSKIALQCLEQK